MQRVHWRQAVRPRNQRIACAVPEKEYWHGLRSTRIRSARNHNYRRDPRKSGASADCFDAVLQAPEIKWSNGLGEVPERALHTFLRSYDVSKRLSLHQGT